MILSAWCAALVLAQASPPFVLELTVTAGKAQQTVRLTEARNQGLVFSGPKEEPRPVLKAAAGVPIHVRWRLTRGAGQPPVPDVLVHFYAARQTAPGRSPIPRDDKAIQVESALKMDFRPGDHSQGEVRFILRQAGTYILRLETLGAASVDGQEHAVGLDLVLH